MEVTQLRTVLLLRAITGPQNDGDTAQPNLYVSFERIQSKNRGNINDWNQVILLVFPRCYSSISNHVFGELRATMHDDESGSKRLKGEIER